MKRLLAVLLVLIGLIGLVLGRLGETTWAPETEATATVELDDPGPAVVINPGVLYVGGMEGEVTIEGASDISLITADNADIEAYLADAAYTRITGASDWSTLSTQEVNPDGATELNDPTSSDLWRSVDTKPAPYTLDVADFAAGEHGENEQVYRAILIVTDGTSPGADSISITWPVEAENEWVPYAYAAGAAIAVVGLVLLVVSIGGRRRDDDEDEQIADVDALDSEGPDPDGTSPDGTDPDGIGAAGIAADSPEPAGPGDTEIEPDDHPAATAAGTGVAAGLLAGSTDDGPAPIPDEAPGAKTWAPSGSTDPITDPASFGPRSAPGPEDETETLGAVQDDAGARTSEQDTDVWNPVGGSHAVDGSGAADGSHADEATGPTDLTDESDEHGPSGEDRR